MTIAPLLLQHGHASVLGDPRPLGVLPLALILRDPSRLPALIVAPSSAHRRAFQRSSSRPSALIVTPSSAHHRALPPRPTRLCMRRRPGEHQQGYNQRTSRLIQRWVLSGNVRLAHQRALASIFQNAWRETLKKLPGGINHLAGQRSCRTRSWWEF